MSLIAKLKRNPFCCLLFVCALFCAYQGCRSLRAEDAPTPTIESLTADVKRLTEQLKAVNEAHEAFVDQSNKTRQADVASCWTDDLAVVQTRYTASLAQKISAEAQKKAAALAKPEPPKKAPVPTDSQ